MVGWALLYAAMVWLGRASRLDGTQTALVWPAAGVAVMWLRGAWARPWWLAVNVVLLWAVTVAINVATGAPTELAGAFGTANTVQAMVTCALLAARPGSLAAGDKSAALLRLAAAAFVGTTAGALSGPASLQLYSSLPWPIDAPVWIFRNGTSTFVLISAALALSPGMRRGGPAKRLETPLVLAAAAAVTIGVFAGLQGVPLAFAIVPASVVVGLRLSVGAASLHTVFTWIVVVASTFAGRGPFAAHSADERVMLTQALVLVVAFSTLTLAHTKQQERELEERLEDERGVVAALVEQLSTDLFICDEHGRLSGFDCERKALVPLAVDARPEEWPQLFGAYCADGSRILEPTELPLYRALHGETVEPTEMVLRADGQDRVVMVSASPVHDAGGRSRGAVARATDVTALRRAEADASERAADLATVGHIAHELAMQTDTSSARQLICGAVCQTAGASLTMLFEPHPDGRGLISTANHGHDDRRPIELPFAGRPSGAVIAFSSAQPFFVDMAVGHPAVNQRLIDETGIVSGLWQPVLRDGLAIAVLAIGWKTQIAAVPGRAEVMLDLLAAEAAIAIDRANLIAQLDDIAHTDPLTGARNRRALTQQLADDQARARQSDQPLSVMMLDLDHFKAFNDQHGHLHGDRMLKEAVAAWEAEVRPTDTVARYGGEEFAIVLPRCGLEDAARLADRLRVVVPHEQTASIGVAQWNPGESCEDLIARADAALYRAKHAGRNQVARADIPPNAESDAASALES